jgi:hypothetical protein
LEAVEWSTKQEDVMSTARRLFSFCLAIFLLVCFAAGQSASTQSAVVPRLVNFSGKAIDGGKIITGVAGATFAIYSEEYSGSPLWMETQNIQADTKGNYTVQLGATTSSGLPLELFSSGEARWLGVRVNGGEEQPRVLLLSVPYALKAADAETIGGLAPSAFVLAAPPAANAASGMIAGQTASVSSAASSDVTTTGGKTNTIPMFTTATNIQNSLLTQTGTTAINVVGKLNFPAVGTATASVGFNSQPQDFVASAYNSSSKAAVAQTFRWQAEALNNNKSTAAGTLTLLYGSGTTTPTETGFKINNKGVITFATGQTFPGSGTGTIKGVEAGADLTGGGTSGTVTLNLDTTKVPLLAANNAFSGSNTFAGAVGIEKTGPASALDVHGNIATDSVFGFSNVQELASPYLTYISAPTSGTLGFFPNGSQQMTITPNGTVGIGTTTPGTGLDMAGGIEIDATGATAFAVQYQGTNAFALNPGSSGNWVLYDHASGSWTEGMIQAGGNVEFPGAVGINMEPNISNPTYQLSIQAADNFAPFIAYAVGPGEFCAVDGSANLLCTGSKNAVVPVDGGSRWVAMSAIESPVNWFEDAGSAKLTNGVAVVELDPTFIQTVNTTMDYEVFPVPHGDCKGLYVTNRTAASFEVRELGGGTSNVDFGYRIMAVRKNYETIRFADHTHDVDGVKRARERTNATTTKPVPHGPARKPMILPKKEALLAP